MLPERFRQSTLLFLLLAYPVTFLFFQGGQYCEPLCFEPTPFAVFELAVILLVLMVVTAAATRVFSLGSPEHTRKSVRWLLSPAPSTGIVLLGVFALFLAFLTLDAVSLYEGVWKPIVLPLSFLVFFPVWVLYMASFPIAMIFSVLGIGFSPVVTLIFRAVVLAIGLPLSVLLQSVTISAIMDGLQSRKG